MNYLNKKKRIYDTVLIAFVGTYLFLFIFFYMIEYCLQNSIPAWIGGMFETGIGRAQNLQIASFLLNAKAHDQSPSSRYFTKDILVNTIEMENGFIHASYFLNPQIDENAFQELTVKSLSLES